MAGLIHRNMERAEAMDALLRAGWNVYRIGRLFGLTGERARQIIENYQKLTAAKST
jgi:hypothetical protein